MNDTTTLQWIISSLLSLIGLMSGFITWYVISIFKKVESNEQQIRRNNSKITELREHINQQLSSILSSQQGVGQELLSVRRTLVGQTVVIERRKAEVSKILEDQKRSKNKLEEMDSRIGRHQKVLEKHESSIVSLGKNLILIKGSQDG